MTSTTREDREAAVRILDTDGIDADVFEAWKLMGLVPDQWEDELQPYEHAAAVVSKARQEGAAAALERVSRLRGLAERWRAEGEAMPFGAVQWRNRECADELEAALAFSAILPPR